MITIPITFTSDVPIFQQIIDGLEVLILTRKIKEGDFLPSVRDFAVKHSVNPNTVARSYKMVQDMGLVENVRGIGLRVLKMKEALAKKRTHSLILEKAKDLFRVATSLEIPIEEIQSVLAQIAKEKA